jgi:hypothetical protein
LVWSVSSHGSGSLVMGHVKLTRNEFAHSREMA